MTMPDECSRSERPKILRNVMAEFFSPLRRTGLVLRHVLKLSVSLYRNTCIEHETLWTEFLVQSGLAYDLKHARVQPHEPDHGALFHRALVMFDQHLES